MKKTAAIFAALVLTATLAPVASAAEKPVSVPGCKPTTAKAHVPAVVKQPTTPAKRIAKTLTLKTNCGDIVIALNSKAPQTVTNIAALANGKFYNKSLCHRLTTEGLYVLQCGDPSLGSAAVPTGWRGFADENLPAAGAKNYPAGTVAMANAGAGTNSSQFFLVYADTQLDPNYTIWGRITKGLDLVKKIGDVGAYKVQGDQAYYVGDGYPIQMVEIIRASAR